MLNNEDVKILNLVIEHVTYIDISIRELVKCLNAWINKNHEDLVNAVQRVKSAESDANKTKVKVVTRVSEHHASLHRTDFLRLTLEMDKIPDYIEGAASRIQLMAESWDFIPDKKLSEKLMKLADAIVKMGQKLRQTIKALLDSPGNTLKFCNEIDKFEAEVDKYYREVEATLFHTDIDIKLMLQIQNIMHHIEEAGDFIQETSDSIRIIIASI
jgi:predicted phosphate transport protein (TIGR00153 family)